MGFLNLNGRLATAKHVLTQKKYFYIFLGVALIYFGAYYLIIEYFLDGFSVFFNNYVAIYAYTAFSLNVLVALLLGANISLVVYKLKEFTTNKKSSFLSGFGVFSAALANGCPGCFAGLFPMVLSVFGISATLSVLPYNGLELQALSAGLLAVSIFFLTGKTRNVCPIK